VAGSAGAPVLRVDAACVANIQLVLWLEQGYGYDRWGAWQLLTQAGGLYVGNMVDKTYSLVASVSGSLRRQGTTGSCAVEKGGYRQRGVFPWRVSSVGSPQGSR
jgi:hypothetical protein